MTVPISGDHLIDLDAPVLPAYEEVIKGTTRWLVWCKHCQTWHRHGTGEGHREAHCNDSSQPVLEDGIQLGVCREVEEKDKS